MLNKKIISKERFDLGFTMIETMVALTLILTVLSAVFAVTRSSVEKTDFSENQLTAVFLAQDAVEYVKHRINRNKLLREHYWWDDTTQCFGGNKCSVDTTEDDPSVALQPCTGCGYDGTFVRYVRLEPVKLRLGTQVGQYITTGVKINAVVEWSDDVGNHRFDVQTIKKQWNTNRE